MDAKRVVDAREGEARSESDSAFLARFNDRMRIPIIVSAILPLIVVPESGGAVATFIGVTTWLVFLFDLVAQVRHRLRYLSTGLGRFDLFVVVATAPWFLLPGFQAGRFIALLRLARLARLVVASKGSRRLFERLGRVALVAAGVTLVGSLVAYYAEHPTNPEFATFGDALWWGIVTLTTVGYGDIVPKTPTGRWAAVTIMVTGIAVLGLLSGSLASFFRLGTDDRADQGGGEALPAIEADVDGSRLESALLALTQEVAGLRREVRLLRDRGSEDEPDRGKPSSSSSGEGVGRSDVPPTD